MFARTPEEMDEFLIDVVPRSVHDFSFLREADRMIYAAIWFHDHELLHEPPMLRKDAHIAAVIRSVGWLALCQEHEALRLRVVVSGLLFCVEKVEVK
jgi:hypothetical protein